MIKDDLLHVGKGPNKGIADRNGALLQHFADAEISQFRLSVWTNEDIVRFNVSVNLFPLFV